MENLFPQLVSCERLNNMWKSYACRFSANYEQKKEIKHIIDRANHEVTDEFKKHTHIDCIDIKEHEIYVRMMADISYVDENSVIAFHKRLVELIDNLLQ